MAVLSQYLNFFVLIVQVFQKVPHFNRLVPTAWANFRYFRQVYEDLGSGVARRDRITIQC